MRNAAVSTAAVPEANDLRSCSGELVYLVFGYNLFGLRWALPSFLCFWWGYGFTGYIVPGNGCNTHKPKGEGGHSKSRTAVLPLVSDQKDTQ